MPTWKLKTAGLALLLAAFGCRAEDAAADADEQVYGILDDRMALLFGPDADPLRLEQETDRLRNVLLAELAAVEAREREELLQDLLEPDQGEPEAPGDGGGEQEEPKAQDVADPGGGAVEQQALKEAEQELQEAVGQEVPGQEAGQEQDSLPTLDERLAAIELRYQEELTIEQATRPSPLRQRVLKLADCLAIAAANARDYQSQKERVYQSALDLTLSRYRFELQYGVTSSYDWTSRDNGSGLPRDRTGSLTTRFSLSKALASGGLLVFDFTTNVFKRFTGIGNTDRDVGSDLTFRFSQPLLSGFGKEIVQEPLVQAERSVLYELRSFERFRREFAVRVASSYYSLLRQLDSIDNARRNYLGVIDSREFAQAQKNAGRIDQISLDRALSGELSARNSYISAVQGYEEALDDFKIQLGLPLVANIAPDPAELEEVRALGVGGVDLDEYAAIRVALLGRLDFQTDIDRLDDSERQRNIAADNLRTILDVNASYSASTDRDTVFDFQGDAATWSAGFDLDLPIDLLAERNSYRRALIGLEAQRRNASLAEDRVKLDVRSSLRRLRELEQTYEIQQTQVMVEERRVMAANINFRKGRVAIREVLEATEALAGVRDRLTTALTNYQVGVMQLYLDLGLLRVNEEGIRFADFVDPGVDHES